MEDTIVKTPTHTEFELRELIAEHYKEWGEIFGNMQKIMRGAADAWIAGDLEKIAMAGMKVNIVTDQLSQMDKKRWKIPVLQSQWVELQEKKNPDTSVPPPKSSSTEH